MDMRVHEQLERVPLCRRRVRIIRRGMAVRGMAMLLLLMVEVMTMLRVVMMMMMLMVLIMVLSVTVAAIGVRPRRGWQAVMRRKLRRPVVAGRMRRTG